MAKGGFYTWFVLKYEIKFLLDRFDQMLRYFYCQQFWVHPFLLVDVRVCLSTSDVVQKFDCDFSMVDLVKPWVVSCINVQDVLVDFENIDELFDSLRFDHVVSDID